MRPSSHVSSTQARSAEILGIDQGSVSKRLNGRLDGFSQQRLIRYLNILGMDVDILVHLPVPPAGGEG